MLDARASVDGDEAAEGFDSRQPGPMLEHALTHWARGRTGLAERALKVLLAFNPAARHLAHLAELSSNSVPAHFAAGIFLVGWDKEGARVVAATVDAVREFVAEKGPMPTEALIIIVRRPEIALSAAIFEIPDAALIEIGSRRSVEQNVAHEVAHVHLRSGCRFLDEGWAWYVQHHLCPSGYPANLETMVQWSRNRDRLVELRALLSLTKSTGPLFE